MSFISFRCCIIHAQAPAPYRDFWSHWKNPTHGRINRPKHRDPIPHAQAGKQHSSLIAWKILNPNPQSNETIYFVEDEYLVTALVPSETACLASSPGRMRRTLGFVSEKLGISAIRVTYEVWISRDEMVDFLV